MVSDVRNATRIAKGPDYTLSEKERSSTIFRRSLFAIKDIAEGEEFTHENIKAIRPGYGILPKHLNELIGKKAVRSLKRGEPVTEEFLK